MASRPTILLVLLMACGMATEGDRRLPVRETTLVVDSPLPSVLGCRPATDLEGTLIVAVADPCALVVATAGVSGRCPAVPVDQNVTAVLVFRETASKVPVAEQVRNIAISETVGDELQVSFVGIDVDTPYGNDGTTNNLERFCDNSL